MIKHLTTTLCITLISLGTALAEPTKIIFDTDFASDCDDAGALAVLHALADLGEAEILAIATNRKCPANASAAAAATINTYYGRPDIPIGTDKDGQKRPIKWNKGSMFTGQLAEEFPHNAKPDDQMPDSLDVYRAALQSQPDGSVVICAVGALSNLQDLVEHEFELIEKKVKALYIMGGQFPRSARPETNIALDAAAAVTVTNSWPTPIVWQGFEIGNRMNNGVSLQNTPKDNPVRRSYELRPFYDGNSLVLGKCNYDLATVLMAVRGVQPELWKESKPGYCIVSSDGSTAWHERYKRDQTYVSFNMHPLKIEKIIEDLLSAPPAKK